MKISALIKKIADKVEPNFSKDHPIAARVLKFVGFTAETVSSATEDVLGYFVEKGKDLGGGLKDVIIGAWTVTSTFLPINSATSLRPAMPKVLRVIRDKTLREHFVRTQKRNLTFAIGYLALLQWPLIYKKMFAREIINNPEENEPINSWFDTRFWMRLAINGSLLASNLVMLFRIVGAKRLLSKIAEHFHDDTLDSMVISEKASGLADNKVFEELRKMQVNENQEDALELNLSAASIDKIKTSIKKIINTKIFTFTELLLKDKTMAALLAFNANVIESKFIAGSGWLIRARIMGKDLAATRLLSAGISNAHVRRIQGHRNFRYIGEGAVYLAMQEYGSLYFYRLLGSIGLTNIPLLSAPANIAIFSLFYNLGMVAANTEEIELREFDWNEEGVNLRDVYKPVFFDPVINRMVGWAERKLGVSNQAEMNPIDTNKNSGPISDFIDLADTKEFTEALAISEEQYLCETPSGKTIKNNFLQQIRNQGSLKLQQYLHYLNVARSDGTGCIQLVTNGVVNSAKGMTNTLNSTIPGGTKTVEVAAAAGAVVFGTPAMIVGGTVFAAHKIAKHGDVIKTTAAAASNVINNLNATSTASGENTLNEASASSTSVASLAVGDSKSNAEKVVTITVSTPTTPVPVPPLSNIQAGSTQATALDIKLAKETTAKVPKKEQVNKEEKQFWQNLMKKRLSKPERAYLQIHAPNLIFFLTTFQLLRKKGSANYLTFLSYVFPPRMKGIVQMYLREFTDYRIKKMIAFLFINQNSYLSKQKQPKAESAEEDSYVHITADTVQDNPDKTKKSAKATALNEEMDEDIERMDITPEEIKKEIKRLRLATAIVLSSKTDVDVKKEKDASPTTKVVINLVASNSAVVAEAIDSKVDSKTPAAVSPSATAASSAKAILPAFANASAANSAEQPSSENAAAAAAPTPASPAASDNYLTQFTEYTSSTVSNWYNSANMWWYGNVAAAENSSTRLKQE